MFLLQDDFLSREEVAVLNSLCDANGCVPGEPEVFELPTDPQGNELEAAEFINFVRTPPRGCSCQLLLPRGPSAVDPRLLL